MKIKKKSLLIVLAFIFLIGLAKAAVPSVDFNWTPETPTVLQPTVFSPDINSTSALLNMNWKFDTDGNTNYYAIPTTDDFESGADGWSTDGGAWALSTTQSHSATHSWSTSGTTVETIYPLSGTIPNTFQWWVRFGDITSINFQTSIGQTSTQTGEHTGFLFTGGTSYFHTNTGNTTLGTGYLVDHWYKLVLTYTSGGIVASGYMYDSDGTTLLGSVVNQATNAYAPGIVGAYNDAGNVVYIDDVNVTGLVDENKSESKTFTTTGTKNICLTAGNSDGNKTTCHDITIGNFSEIPVITQFDFNATTGFGVTDANTHLIFNCDSNSSILHYFVTFNGVTVYDANTTGKRYVAVTALNGNNVGTFVCTAVISATDSKSFVLYQANFLLVSEETGAPLSSYAPFGRLTLTSYNTDLNYDFKAASKNRVLISSLTDDSYRLDINYVNGDLLIGKDFALSALVPDINISLCVSTTSPTLYPQVFTSSTEQAVIVKRVPTNCYALADYTKYAYQTVKAQSTYTIEGPYNVYYFSNGVKILLTDIDGATALVQNLQTLILNEMDFNIVIADDYVGISPYLNAVTNKNDLNHLRISYKSFAGTNESTQFTIYLGSTAIWSQTETESPNEIAIYWDFTSYGLSDQNILKLVVTKTLSDGTIKTLTKYFTISGAVYGNQFSPMLAIVIGVLILAFGLTFVSTKAVFGWFGIAIVLIALAYIASAPQVWYVVFMTAVLLIILTYIGLTWWRNESQVS